jgi:ABC-type dipeptide/oligopeptide/nickel transport system permease subunit/ABC-type dipeptide/oligopeptide/nickel transport system permease component
MIQVPEPRIIFYPHSPIELEQEPILIQFVKYLASFFSGDWLNSNTIYRDSTVFELLGSSVPRMIEIMIIPLVIGFILGKFLKRILRKKDHNRLKKIFIILGGIGVVTPIFWLGYYLQKNFIGILPVSEWDGHTSPLVTGFLLLDSMIAGEGVLSLQIFVYMILPILFLTMLITALTTKNVMPKISRYCQSNSIISNSLQTGMMFSLIFTIYILIDATFVLRGFSSTILVALRYPDFFLLRGSMFIIIILFVISTFISNFYFILKSSTGLNLTNNHAAEEVEEKTSRNLKEEVIDLKKDLFNRLKSPFSIVGVSIIVFLIIIAIIPQLITPYTLSDITPPSFGVDQYAPPSLEHPLGTAHYGYDLVALVIWGLRDLLVSGGWIIIIGLMGGLPFGILASKFNRSDKQIILYVMSLFFIFPSIVITVFMLLISDLDHSVQVFIIGILLIPLFTRKIANTKPKFTNILKELIIYIPWVLFLVILLYTSASFLGFADILTPQLGYTIYRVHFRGGQYLNRFRAVFWSGLAIFALNIGLLLLNVGLNSKKRKTE